MRPPVVTALEIWEETHHTQQLAAAATLRAAFPVLALVEPPTGCCDIRLTWSEDGSGAGSVCVDQDSRVTVEATGLPHRAVGEALDELFGIGWFDGAPEGIVHARTGTYSWSCDSTSAELEVEVGDGQDGTTLYFGYATVPDATALLDELHIALVTHTARGSAG